MIINNFKKMLKKKNFYPNNNDKCSSRHLLPVISTHKHVFEIIDKTVGL